MTTTRFAQHPDGTIKLKSYRLPFRPEYVLLGTPAGEYTSAAQPTGKNVPAFRFHLSPEAHALVRAQDPRVKPSTGFSTLTIKFDAVNSGYAIIEVTRGVTVDEEGG